MPKLAERLLGTYEEGNRDRRLDNRFRLQLVAGRYADAARSLADLRSMRVSRRGSTAATRALNVQYEVYARAKGLQAAGTAFDQSVPRAFRETFARLDDRTAALVIRALGTNIAPLESTLRRAVAAQESRTTISVADALALVRAYQVLESFRALAPMTPPLIAEDDARRYVITKSVLVPTGDGATMCVLILRPRQATAKLPAILEFTIYADSVTNFREARRSASNGYAGVSGLTRGKACSPDKPWPYVNDAHDASALIEWIAKQPWSDGRVGMFGGSYNGFTTWAATKRRPKALKAIMAGSPVAPGIDVPMEGNVAWYFIYPWPFYSTNNKWLDNDTYNDNVRWQRLNRDWYTTGRAFRDLDKIDGTPNPVFDEWISHPTYDAYWQAMIPYGPEFRDIDIPVLQTAGYYFGGPGAAMYYFTEHYAHNAAAQHYLVIGPYDHFQAQRGVVDALGDTSTILAGYEIDPVARIDIVADLRYQFFDWVLRGGPRPSLLADKLNYQVTGANVWKHAPNVNAMANGRMRLHLTPVRLSRGLKFAATPSDSFVDYRIDLRSRTDIERKVPGGGVSAVELDTVDVLEFVSEPLSEATEVSGLFSGHLELVTNRKDFDLYVALFELTAGGRYIQLAPFYSRASHFADLTTRRLLTPGARERLDFTSRRLMSRRVAAGSRIVAVIGVIKNPGQQINYGTGKDVNDETIADVREPVSIRLFGKSYIDLPIRR
jgi:putative CocE/NonD family hydrolase